ncbi:Sec-independent protein translocase subunit TatA/TatB [Paraglaciecola arctica]|uniref:Sec-independent protein translocase subunit TatA/TatB n=1 Tax=Paraglaciecola arctica TaxID=1128911 RepID=UPI001C0660A1|nr:preprotein translocase subunit TatB [Paraglaciecola arctica]MBU3002551.1 preprotein translocase subunit TatB [Paraglaciecola arctica]
MFDFSWIELGFCAALTLVVVGPKDLPAFVKGIGKLMTKGKKMVNEVKGSLSRLEKEIDLSDATIDQDKKWKTLLPSEIQHLPEDFIPGSLPPSEHQKVRQQRKQALVDMNCDSESKK